MQQTDAYGQIIREGIIFGYLCWGKTSENQLIYRFGKTTKTHHVPSHNQFISKLGGSFAGLNKPQATILFEKVGKLDQVWDILRDYLRGHIKIGLTATARPKIFHETHFGDNFWTLRQEPEIPYEEFEKHLQEIWSQLLELAD